MEDRQEFMNRQIDVSQLPDYNDIHPVKIGKALLKKNRLNTLIFYLVVLIASALFLWISGQWGEYKWIYLLGILVFTIFIALIFYVQYLNWDSMKYAMRMKDMYFEKGWFYNMKVVVPFNRIQHATVVETFMDKTFGIAQLKIYTAGGGSSDLILPGLTPTEANSIRDFILKKGESIDEEE